MSFPKGTFHNFKWRIGHDRRGEAHRVDSRRDSAALVRADDVPHALPRPLFGEDEDRVRDVRGVAGASAQQGLHRGSLQDGRASVHARDARALPCDPRAHHAFPARDRGSEPRVRRGHQRNSLLALPEAGVHLVLHGLLSFRQDAVCAPAPQGRGNAPRGGIGAQAPLRRIGHRNLPRRVRGASQERLRQGDQTGVQGRRQGR